MANKEENTLIRREALGISSHIPQEKMITDITTEGQGQEVVMIIILVNITTIHRDQITIVDKSLENLRDTTKIQGTKQVDINTLRRIVTTINGRR